MWSSTRPTSSPRTRSDRCTRCGRGFVAAIDTRFDLDDENPEGSFEKASGFVAAHVFEAPGSYRVRARVHDVQGRTGPVIMFGRSWDNAKTHFFVSAQGFQTLADWHSFSSQDADSLLEDPVPGNALDFYGNARDEAPDRGAVEFTSRSADIPWRWR